MRSRGGAAPSPPSADVTKDDASNEPNAIVDIAAGGETQRVAIIFAFLSLIAVVILMTRPEQAAASATSAAAAPPAAIRTLPLTPPVIATSISNHPALVAASAEADTPTEASKSAASASVAAAAAAAEAFVEGGGDSKAAEAAGADEEAALAEQVETLGDEVRRLRSAGKIADGDANALDTIVRLQALTRRLLSLRYGGSDSLETPFRVELTLRFPDSMPDFAEKGASGDSLLLIDLAPSELMPHAIFTFLEVRCYTCGLMLVLDGQIAVARAHAASPVPSAPPCCDAEICRAWKGGAFHRRAGHVLQAQVDGGRGPGGLRFQEYSPQYPHEKHTLGFAGRPGGPPFYISTVDNVRNHGPGSQGSATEVRCSRFKG